MKTHLLGDRDPASNEPETRPATTTKTDVQKSVAQTTIEELAAEIRSLKSELKDVKYDKL